MECNYYTGKKLSVIPPKFNRLTGVGEAEVPVTDSTSNYYNNGMCPAYTIEILEDVGHAFASAILDLVEDNPISRIPLSKFKTLEGVRTEVSNTLRKAGPVSKMQNYVVTKENKPPIKVKIKAKKQQSFISKPVSKPVTKPELKKATSMPPTKPKSKAILKSKSDLSGGLQKLKPRPQIGIAKTKSIQSQVSTAASSHIRQRVGGSADVRQSNLEKRKKPSGLLKTMGTKKASKAI